MAISNSTTAPESESAGNVAVRWEAAQGHLVYAAGRAELRISGAVLRRCQQMTSVTFGLWSGLRYGTPAIYLYPTRR